MVLNFYKREKKCYFYCLKKINILIVVETVMGPGLFLWASSQSPRTRKVSYVLGDHVLLTLRQCQASLFAQFFLIASPDFLRSHHSFDPQLLFSR